MQQGRPEWLFARDAEWARLLSFAQPTAPGTALALVYGRRRQGKTALLEALTDATGGFYWQALEQSAAQNLHAFSRAWSTWRGGVDRTEFTTWTDAVDAIFHATGDSPSVLMIDEFGYLMNVVPDLPSLLQAKVTPRSQRSGTTRLILCGSAFAQMRGLLAGSAPLRGRAILELVVGPFDYRTAARYWGLHGNHDDAFQLHALVGGTAAYLPLAGNAPKAGRVEKWMIDHLLDPTSPLFREGRILVGEDPSLSDRALYWGLLGAIAEGHTRKSDLAHAVGRSATALAFPLAVLTRSGWIEQRPDPLHRNRSSVVVTEPLLRFHRLVIEPEERRLVRGDARRVALDYRAVISSQIYGPHLESIAGEWALIHATPATMGGTPRLVAPGILTVAGQKHQIDIVAVERTRQGGDRIHAIGEVKATRNAVGVNALARLDALAGDLRKRSDATIVKLVVARGGFTSELEREAGRRPDVQLVDLARLYDGE